MITASGGLTDRPDLAVVDSTEAAPVAAKGDPDAVEVDGDRTRDRGPVERSYG